MKVNRRELLKVLTAVQPGLANKEVVEQSQSFVFTKKHVMTFNDEIAVVHPISFEMEGAVQAAPLFKLLGKYTEDDVDLEATDVELRIKGARSRAGIRLDAEIALPISEIGKPKDWVDLPEGFMEAVRFVLFCAARTEGTNPVLVCVHAEGDFVEACDNFRLTRRYLPKSAEPLAMPLVFPASAARKLGDYNPLRYCATPGWVHFQMENGMRFSCRTFAENYPNLDALLEVEGSKIKMPVELPEILERADIFSESEPELGEIVGITVWNNTLQVEGKCAHGWFKERVNIPYDGDKMCFNVSTQFFRQTVGMLDEVMVGEKKLKINGPDFEHVVYLMVDATDEAPEEDAPPPPPQNKRAPAAGGKAKAKAAAAVEADEHAEYPEADSIPF